EPRPHRAVERRRMLERCDRCVLDEIVGVGIAGDERAGERPQAVELPDQVHRPHHAAAGKTVGGYDAENSYRNTTTCGQYNVCDFVGSSKSLNVKLLSAYVTTKLA